MFSNAPLSEPVAVPDTFASGIARIENLGNGNFRFTLYVGHQSLIDHRLEREIVARIVMSRADIKRAILAAEIAIAGVEGAVDEILIDKARDHGH